MRLIVLSGLSGSGKSVALHMLEDLGWFCVDNIPAALLKSFLSHTLRSTDTRYQRVAVGLDARNTPEEIATVPALLAELSNSGLACELLFVTASEEALLRRYADTRRKHPLSRGGENLRAAIAREHELLEPVAQAASVVIDTSHIGVHHLRELVRARVERRDNARLALLFQSFGYKHGIPGDADYVFDARALPNPYWEPALRPLTGRDAPVASFLVGDAAVERLLNDITGFIEARIPEFTATNRRYLSVAIGCTGGQHRSVYLVEQLAAKFANRHPDVAIRHARLPEMPAAESLPPVHATGVMGLLDRYEMALRQQARVGDPAQRAVAERLAALDDCLDGTPAPARWRRRLASITGRQGYAATCRGIYLWGGVGRGKTWLMDLFAAGRGGGDCQRLHFQHFMREVHTRRRGVAGHERPLDRVAAQLARTARVWCLDEFMVQDIGDAMILHGVLDGLLKRGVVLVLTSNTPPARLYEGGLQRERFRPAIDLLQRLLDVIEIGSGEDFRLRQLAGTDTYLPSADPRTGEHLQQLFERLAGPAAVDRGGDMLIEDRRIPTIAHAGRLAWFGFAALCEGPRAAADYIALARRLHTVFLSDVPVFDGGNDDAARRFVALIDELYDQRVQLVISAAAEPGALYRGERLRADFARTASRLTGMRKASWIGYRNVPDVSASA